MIYTCTLNPAIDYKIKMDHLELEGLNRFDSGEFLIGGKGINVSIGLRKFGIKSIATGFLGGLTGHYIKDYIEETLKLESKFIMVDQLTRVNVKVLINEKETELNHTGLSIRDEDANKLLKDIDTLNKKDILICGGSSAKGQDELYEQIAKHCYDHQIEFVMDTPSKYMEQYINYKPLLMKPNQLELETYALEEIGDLQTMIKVGKQLILKGAKNLIVSLGKDGSLFFNQDKVYQSKPLKGIVKNTVGAGDSMVAGFIAAYSQGLDPVECYRCAVASASATTFGNEILDMEVYQEYIKKVEIEEIKE